jgi:ribosomal protein L11 methyltransferase
VVVSAPAWTEIRVLCPQGWHEVVAEALAVPPCTSVAFGTTGDAPAPPAGFEWVTTFLAASDDSPAARASVRARLDALARASEASELSDLAIGFASLSAEDYASSWRAFWKPFRIGRLCVVPSWTKPVLRPTDVPLRLEPGGAFGSGRHATTRACIALLCARIRGGERVLDAGSGSGILSVAACLLGAASSLGFDVDRHARPHAEHLAAENAVASRCRFLTADFEVLAREPGPYDVVLANLYSDLVQAHARRLARILSPTGWFAFSGCPREHLDATLAALGRTSLAVDGVISRGRWRTIYGRA